MADKKSNIMDIFLFKLLPAMEYYDTYPKLYFRFIEEDAYFQLNSMMSDYKETDHTYDVSKHLFFDYAFENNLNDNTPPESENIIIVKNYQLFFTLINQIAKSLFIKKQELENKPNAYSTLYGVFSQMWCRMTAVDFSDVELFLQRELNFIQNSTFDNFFNPRNIDLEILNSYQLQIKNNIATEFDETYKFLEFKIVDTSNEQFHSGPVIRYGIRTEDNHEICYISGFQNKSKAIIPEINSLINKDNKAVYSTTDEDFKIYQKLKRDKKISEEDYLDNRNNITFSNLKKIKALFNKASYPENIADVNPSSVLSLVIFITLLYTQGITKIKVPCYRPLSHEYHIEHFKFLGLKRNLLSYDENTNDRFIRIFRRLMFHFDGIEMLNLPMIEDSYITFDIKNIDFKSCNSPLYSTFINAILNSFTNENDINNTK